MPTPTPRYPSNFVNGVPPTDVTDWTGHADNNALSGRIVNDENPNFTTEVIVSAVSTGSNPWTFTDRNSVAFTSEFFGGGARNIYVTVTTIGATSRIKVTGIDVKNASRQYVFTVAVASGTPVTYDIGAKLKSITAITVTNTSDVAYAGTTGDNFTIKATTAAASGFYPTDGGFGSENLGTLQLGNTNILGDLRTVISNLSTQVTALQNNLTTLSNSSSARKANFSEGKLNKVNTLVDIGLKMIRDIEGLNGNFTKYGTYDATAAGGSNINPTIPLFIQNKKNSKLEVSYPSDYGRNYPANDAVVIAFTGPTSGTTNTASASFTVTPSAPYTGTISLSVVGGATGATGAVVKAADGTTTITSLTFANSSAPQTFKIVPSATIGTKVVKVVASNIVTTQPTNISVVVAS